VDKSRNRYNDTAIADIQLALQLEKDRRRINDYYFSLINLYDRQGNKKQSMHYAMIALETAEQDKDTSVIISTCYRIGNYLRDYQHNYEVALLYYEKILELCKQLKNAGQETAAVLNDMGDVYKLMGENSYALSLYRESLALAEQIQHRHSRSNAYKNIGNISNRVMPLAAINVRR
jgi:tetratricopeptide (TPR) repeat protein